MHPPNESIGAVGAARSRSQVDLRCERSDLHRRRQPIASQCETASGGAQAKGLKIYSTASLPFEDTSTIYDSLLRVCNRAARSRAA